MVLLSVLVATHIPNYSNPEENVEDFKTYKNNSMNNNEGSFNALTDRSISLETAKKFGVKTTTKADGSIHSHLCHYIANEIVGTKNLGTVLLKTFLGSSPKGTMLFGQQICQTGGKFITVTEGECDAMAAYEMMGSKWPVVSVKNGAGGGVRDVKENLEFLESFDNVVICFDNDKAGKGSSAEGCKII